MTTIAAARELLAAAHTHVDGMAAGVDEFIDVLRSPRDDRAQLIIDGTRALGAVRDQGNHAIRALAEIGTGGAPLGREGWSALEGAIAGIGAMVRDSERMISTGRARVSASSADRSFETIRTRLDGIGAAFDAAAERADRSVRFLAPA